MYTCKNKCHPEATVTMARKPTPDLKPIFVDGVCTLCQILDRFQRLLDELEARDTTIKELAKNAKTWWTEEAPKFVAGAEKIWEE